MKSFLTNALLVVISVLVGFAGLEGFLRVSAAGVDAKPPPAITVPPRSNNFDADIVIPPEVAARADARKKLLTMPDSWKRKPVEVPAPYRAEYWQGVFEIYNAEGMRWATPYPERKDGVYRVLVVGDSLTYGEGIAEEWTFTSLLNRRMGKRFRIEFLNLGHDGFQSEDVLNAIKTHVPLLKPDLVLYAVCQNDFLPSGRGQYNKTGAYPFPLPEGVKKFLIANTRPGAFLNELYDGALRRVHLRADFFDDILADFQDYRTRFARDVAEMNASVLSAGLPPLVAMVVDQYPAYGSRGYRITKIAEEALARAGAVVIPTEDYYRRYDGQGLYVSRWEGHPNEAANIIWANMFAKALQDRDDLKAFARTPTASTPLGQALTK